MRAVFLWGAGMLLAAGAAQAAGFEPKAPGFDGGKLPLSQVGNQNGCTGNNISPAIVWEALPNGTKSVAVTMFDPDANQGQGFWHWIIYNIPPTLKGLPAGAGNIDGSLLPQGARQGKNDAGVEAYSGACPPVGARDHRYLLTVWALNVDALPAEAGSSGTAFTGFLNKYGIEKKSVSATYGR